MSKKAYPLILFIIGLYPSPRRNALIKYIKILAPYQDGANIHASSATAKKITSCFAYGNVVRRHLLYFIN